MSLLIDSLNKIFGCLEKNNHAVADSLQPGLSYQNIEEKVTSLPFQLPQELYELYQWRNGTPEDSKSDNVDFFLNYRFIPLEESIKIRFDLLKDDSWIIDWLFPYAWFPIFTFSINMNLKQYQPDKAGLGGK